MNCNIVINDYISFIKDYSTKDGELGELASQ